MFTVQARDPAQLSLYSSDLSSEGFSLPHPSLSLSLLLQLLLLRGSLRSEFRRRISGVCPSGRR